MTTSQVIHLVRDPRAVASSRLKSKEGLIRESLQVLRYSNLHPRQDEAEVPRTPGGLRHAPPPLRHRVRGSTRLNALAALGVICEGQHRSLELALQQPEWLRGRYMLVRYEDVVRRPKQALSAMYNFLGLTPTPDLLNFTFAMVHGQHYGDEGDPFQVSVKTALSSCQQTIEVLQKSQKSFVFPTYCIYQFLYTHSAVGFLKVMHEKKLHKCCFYYFLTILQIYFFLALTTT